MTAPQFTSELAEHPIAWGIVRSPLNEAPQKMVTTLLETTPVPGLAIGPELHATGFTGQWVTTHIRSGRNLLFTFETVEGVRNFVWSLGQISTVDWTADMDTVAAAVQSLPDKGRVIREAWVVAMDNNRECACEEL